MKNPNQLQIELAERLSEPSKDEAVAVCVFKHEGVEAHDESIKRACERLMQDGEFKGEEEASLLFRSSDESGGRRILLLGLGDRANFDNSVLSRAAGMAVRQARAARIKRLSLILPASGDDRTTARAASEGAVLGLYENNFYQRQEEERVQLEALTIIVGGASDALRDELERGQIVAESVNWARALSDEPGATLPPREFARRAAEMAEEFGLRVESLNAEEIQSRGLGALWGVGKGSDNEPALIVIRYEPEEPTEQDELWAFVGKGITFDTGGISIKHGLYMYEMKADMAGGAAVLGAMRAIAQLKPRR
ncbi:MAG TPA: M17 family peptidase N-terminal domain-containing protein, partial [Pyrinomonadaceae bacterium]|nr:M17 family peptidase N-terminal domain-containing protein [Pyrinomonadaceae bacterium]